VIAVGFAALAGGLLTGRIWAYWPSAAVLALFALSLTSKAIGNHAPASAVASGLLIVTLVGLILPSSRRVRMRVERSEDQEAMRHGWLMPRRTRALLALVGIAIASLGALGFFATVKGVERLEALAISLFGSACVLVSLGSKPIGESSDPQRGTIAFQGSARPALLFRLNKIQGRAMTAGAAAMAAACGFLTASEFRYPKEDRLFGIIIGTVGTFLFGLCALAWGSSSVRGTVAFVRDGILVPFLGTVLVPWEAVRKAGVFHFGVTMIGLDIYHPEAVQMASWRRALNALNGWLLNAVSRRLGVWDLTFSSAFLGSSPDLFERAVQYYRDHPDERRHIGSEPPAGFTEPAEGS